MAEMHSWTRAASPNIKFEGSPTESLLSTPDEMYPSLFGTSSSQATTVNPLEMMSPESLADDSQPDLKMLAGLTALSQTALAQSPAPTASVAGTPEPEKKQAKKRKSWGQVLPEPKTNLPPRKRAKTEDEKEQRRVERVLRNRRAAQSSRERKRLEVEGLEQRNKELETALLQAQQMNLTLLEEIQKFRQSTGVVPRASPSFEALRQTPVTFSQQLFGSQDGHGAAMNGACSLEQLFQSIPSSTHKTVNPASLSPALSPISEAAEELSELAAVVAPVADVSAAAQANASPDATQHPAVSVGGSTSLGVADGIPATAAPSTGAAPAAPVPSSLHLGDGFCMPEALDADRYLLESGLLSSPNSTDYEYDHLAGDDTTPFPFATDFDINDFITDGEPNVAPSNEQQPQHLYSRSVADSSLFNPETPNPSEDPYLQPHPGASLTGCDDGGLAVGVN
jgi:transcriptional activator HAC1